MHRCQGRPESGDGIAGLEGSSGPFVELVAVEVMQGVVDNDRRIVKRL